MNFIDHMQSQEIIEGAGARVNRVFPPLPEKKHFDPFILLDHFHVEPPHGFPTHPHQGFEAITYMIGGKMHHQDKLGNDSQIGAGGAQVFSAGPGFEHSEMPLGEETAVGLQLWIKRPASAYEEPSSYQGISADDLPVSSSGGVTRRTICGAGSPVKLMTDVLFCDLEMEDESEWKVDPPPEFIGFVYVLSGEVFVNEKQVFKGSSIHWEGHGDLRIHARAPSRIAYACGRPHHEKIILHGPFVKRGV